MGIGTIVFVWGEKTATRDIAEANSDLVQTRP
jgi:hypothetical protein